ncbi:MAG: hypothetical protein QCI82_07865 [Candidatus Thermoplasmatota archaeon]|nr:hypothetical protein [Candidatus Thermoplasmatota archaeon]
MTQYQSLLSEPFFWIMIAVIAILVVITIIMIIRLIFKKREDHVAVYFEGNFRTMIGEWDLVTRPNLRKWKNEAAKRLGHLDKEVGSIEKMRKNIDGRLNALNNDIVKLERY